LITELRHRPSFSLQIFGNEVARPGRERDI
jgi:hypothetical protein